MTPARSATRSGVLAGALLLATACGSSSSNDSLVGSWTNGASGGSGNFSSGGNSASFIFQSGGSCSVDVGSGSQMLCGDCTYTQSGDSLTLTLQTTVDGGAQESITCDCALAFSNGGNSLEVKTKGGTNCPALDVTVNRVTDGSFAFFCSM